MCSILYTTKATDYKLLQPLIQKQLPRGEHSLGIIGGKARKKWDTQGTVKAIPFPQGAQKVIEYIQDFNKEYNKKETGILMHMRKPSIGDNDINNAHPVKITERYIILQNGTNKLITNFAKIAYRDYDSNRSDTYYLGRYLVDAMTTGNILQALSALKRMSKHDTVGIVFLIDLKKKTVLFYSDGARECRIDKTKKHVNMITNYHPTENIHKYKVDGFLIFDLDNGRIKGENIKETKKMQTTTAYTNTHNYNTTYEENKYWPQHNYNIRQKKEVKLRWNQTDITRHKKIIKVDREYIPSKKKCKKIIKIVDIKKSKIETLIEFWWIHTAMKIAKNIRRYTMHKPEHKDNLILAIEQIDWIDTSSDTRELLSILSEQYTADLERDLDIRLSVQF